MNISLILGTPDPGSFCHAISKTALESLAGNGHRVNFHDLYSEGFDPILPAAEIPRDAALPADIDRHCREIREADGTIIIHPNWWGQPPAILKGWIDRVIRPGIAYEFEEGDNGEGIPRGLLKAHTALLFTTGNTPAAREQAAFGDPLETLWRNCIFGLCGVSDFLRTHFSVIVTSTSGQRAAWLEDVEQIVSDHFPGE